MSRLAITMDEDAIEDLKIRLQALTGMEEWTKTQVGRRAVSILKDDLMDRLEEAGEVEEYERLKEEHNL